MKYQEFRKNKLSQIILFTLSLTLSACGDSDNNSADSVITKPSVPSGLGQELTVDAPVSVYPLPVVDNVGGNNGDGPDGTSVNKYDIAYNPIIKILSGINSIWTLGDDTWANGSANGSGPSDYSNERIVDGDIWRENMTYVVDVTNRRTYQQALDAYLDDRRDQNYSVIDGLGPMTNDYLLGSGAIPAVAHTVADANRAPTDDLYFDVNEVITYSEPRAGDNSATMGSPDSDLGEVVSLVQKLRDSSASTSPAKYYYSTARPWRMNDNGEVIEDTSQTETIGDREFQVYESNVKIVPALKYVRRIAADGRRKDSGYPSGHTNAGYLAAWAYAYAMPERFSEMLTRASELGENRILAGMHSPLDVIGARIQSSAVSAAAMYDMANTAIKQAAYDKAGEYFSALAGDMGIYEYAHQANETDRWADHDAVKALYRQRITYGFTQDTTAAGADPVVPLGAEALLETRQPYLTPAQRRAVLYTTEVDSGYPVLDASNGWGRLDYVTAADGYGAFLGDVTVTMDASKGRFNAHDWWRNDIYGAGLLTKAGTGMLTLTGHNSYTGGTLVQGGTLEAESTTAFGYGDLYLQDGKVNVAVDGALILAGNFTMDAGTLAIAMDEDTTQVSVAGTIYLAGGTLTLDFSEFHPTTNFDVTLLAGKEISGKFNSVSAEGYNVTLEYRSNSVIAHIAI